MEALKRAVDDGALTLDELPDIVVERTRDPAHGDFACPSALALAKAARRHPRDIAAAIAERLPVDGIIAKHEIAGPGFINLTLSANAYQGLVQTIREQRENFGRSNIGAGRKIQVEFVSSNPTGPLHVGHGRGAAYGSAIADLLEAVGHDVQREYYVNDAGRQMHILTASVWLRYLELYGYTIIFPANGYKGSYVSDIAQLLQKSDGDTLARGGETIMAGLPPDEPEGGDKEKHIDAIIEKTKDALGKSAYQRVFDLALNTILDSIGKDLEEFGVTFQRWYSERSLSDSGAIDKAVRKLRRAGHVYEQDGALWFRSTDFGDEKDRVVIRDNGEGTYFASDIAYHIDKLERGFDRVINVWGADHHGYIARVRGALIACGEDADRLTVQLVQFANLVRGGEIISMSTRGGEFVTLRELYAQVGTDAARFFYTMRKNDQHMDFDLELATQQNRTNPVFYVQYAHARVCSVARRADEAGIAPPALRGEADLNRLTHRAERDVMVILARYPDAVESAALDLSPHTLAQYLRDLATALHAWYDLGRTDPGIRVLVDDSARRKARMALADAARIVLANGLGLLGVSAPESM